MKKTLLGIITLLLGACSNNTNPIIDSQSILLKDGSAIKLTYGCGSPGMRHSVCHDSTDGIRKIDPSDKVKNVTGNIVGGVLCITSLGNICAVSGFKDPEELVGSKLEIEDTIRTYAYPKYKTLLEKKLKVSKKADYTNTPIEFFKQRSYLVYDNSSTNNLYTLEINFSIYPFATRVDKSFKCKERKSGLTEEQWKENNYSKVIYESKLLIDKCMSNLDDAYFEKLGKHFDEEISRL